MESFAGKEVAKLVSRLSATPVQPTRKRTIIFNRSGPISSESALRFGPARTWDRLQIES